MLDGLKQVLRLRPLRFVSERSILNLGRCGPVGLWGRAPGTNGTVVGLLLYTALFHQLGLFGQLMLLLPLLMFAVLVCDEYEQRRSQLDPGELILDEIVAVPLCFVGHGAALHTGQSGIWIYMLAGFVLFRIFDILKPFGIARLQNLQGGIGVVADDVAAALATNLSLWLGVWAAHAGGWLP